LSGRHTSITLAKDGVLFEQCYPPEFVPTELVTPPALALPATTSNSDWSCRPCAPNGWPYEQLFGVPLIMRVPGVAARLHAGCATHDTT
jgi:hypothetical protein